MANTRKHFEEYIYLAGLTHTAAFIGWGGFEFKVKGATDDEEWALIDDDEIEHHHPSRRGSIGVSSSPLAEQGTLAKIELREEGTGKIHSQQQGGANRFHVRDLKPDTLYTYRILVKLPGEPDFREWGAGPLRDWDVEGGRRGMRLLGNTYKNEFRTFPDPDKPASDVNFAVIGDFGRGVREASSAVRCQRDIARALKAAVTDRGIRFILTTGDNIYHNREGGGSEDDDWFYTYFQPYRYIINRVPVYPTVGNHDEGESENTDDRSQLYDNFFIVPRFTNLKDLQDASTEPGLFYRFRYGSEIEFICLDTSKKRKLFADRYFEHKDHRAFIDNAFRPSRSPRWRIPFSHHPPYSAGPQHHNTRSMIKFFSDRFRNAGVRAVFSGHEHNFQHSIVDGVNYFVSGGAGEIREGTPSSSDFQEAKTKAWGGNDEGHFLFVEIKGDRMAVTPIAKLSADGQPRKLNIKDTSGKTLDNYAPIEVNL